MKLNPPTPLQCRKAERRADIARRRRDREKVERPISCAHTFEDYVIPYDAAAYAAYDAYVARVTARHAAYKEGRDREKLKRPVTPFDDAVAAYAARIRITNVVYKEWCK
jgi:hypothetical protein